MKIVVVMDSFKGSLTSLEAGNAVKEGILSVNKTIDVVVKCIADGGEGTIDALVEGMNGTIRKIQVTGPLGTPVTCKYGILEESKLAILEMAQAAGLPFVPDDQRNPMITTTYGVGEMILDAIRQGCRKFIIGIGGSATNDGGVGMLQALGFEFLDECNKQIKYGAQGLSTLAKISTKNILPQLKECEFLVACDVENPLYGEKGASVVYGPQKGADEKMVMVMDQLLYHYACKAKELYPDADSNYPGSGAAGGLGFAFHTFLQAELKPGIQIILDEIKLEEVLQNADLVITGEGRLDEQSMMGKALSGIAKLARKHHIPVLALAGCLGKNAHLCLDHGIDAYHSIMKENMSIEEAMQPIVAKNNLKEKTQQIMSNFLTNHIGK